MRALALDFALAAIVLAVNAHAHDPFPVLIVDKSKYQLHIGSYQGDHVELGKSYHCTLGKVSGDKEVEADLKTPEGIYFFTGKRATPVLTNKKLGVMALHVDYPNPVDRLAGKTGYAIMLHATFDPDRLKRDQDSEGCVVVDNPEIVEISKSVRLGLTPLIIYSELKASYLKKESDPELVAAFEKWLTAWRGKDLENYIGSYASQFRYNGMNLKQYREYKKSLNERYAEISVETPHLRFFYHPKYNVVTFTQRYESKLKNGSKGFKSAGTKMLYFVKAEGVYKIADEAYSSVKED